jgi:hypothetical protein
MNTKCESCGGPIEDGQYCGYCTDTEGNLQAFDERFERMVQWTLRQGAAPSKAEAEQQTLAYMATMPAWREHPRVAGRG